MDLRGWSEILFTLGITVALAIPLGAYLARVWQGQSTWLDPVLRPVEGALYWTFGVDPKKQQNWFAYALSLLAFSIASFVVLYLILRFQNLLPFNPQNFPGTSPDLAFNTSVSFITNTNWQSYTPEATLSAFSQMAGLTSHNFLSAAAGIALAAAVSRAFAAHRAEGLGNFWVDLTRISLYVLLPLSIVIALTFVALGMPQTLTGHVDMVGLEGAKQTNILFPTASQEAIKQLGTNGGGIFNANSAHPYENPNAITNLIEEIEMNTLGYACAFAFGIVALARRDSRALVAVMALFILAAASIVYVAETQPAPALHAVHAVAQVNMEGKEVRFGAPSTATWTAFTTGASDGGVNAMHDSYMPLAGGVAMFMIQLGETLPGGVGSGLYGIIVMAVIAVFVAGLMVGRTPEYLGKKIDVREIKLTVIGVIAVPLTVIILTAIAIGTRFGLSSVFNAGPQGFSETLYAYTSQTNNNGSAFAGYSGYVQPHAAGNVGAHGIAFADFAGGIAMLLGRFFPMLVALAVAGSLAGKRTAEVGPGTLRTDNAVFVVIVIGTITVVALLTFIPALMLGPLVQALTGRLF
jgi:potassium-transporting ATPase potassium-binding subunit